MSGQGEDGAPRGEAEDLPPWMQPVDADATGIAEESRLVRWRGRLVVAVAIAGFAMFSTALWLLYRSQSQPPEPIVVAAPEGPVRVAPEDPGGLQVEHRDMAVYGQLAGEGEQGAQPVRLRPDPEAPSEGPSAPRIALAGLEPQPVVGAGAAAMPAAYVAQARQGDEGTGGAASDPQPETAATGAPGADGWAVQIAAYRQERHARAFMAQSRSDHRDIFGDMDGWVVKARKNMANYYRVRFGPLPDRDAALATCGAIRDAGLNCLVIAPGE